jgi:hypothetical protein
LEESVRKLVETQALVGAPGAYRLAKALPCMQRIFPPDFGEMRAISEGYLSSYSIL